MHLKNKSIVNIRTVEKYEEIIDGIVKKGSFKKHGKV